MSADLTKVSQIRDALLPIMQDPDFAGCRFGLAGSYARGEETPDSDIDIVVDTDKEFGLSIEEMERIKASFDCDTDVLQLRLLKEEDEELDAFLLEEGLPINKSSAYKSILREVIWFEE
jgi:predicted nucleotidyltransferase